MSKVAEGHVAVTTEPFTLSVRVYWEDTDAAGVVYHANYFKFMERARTEWLRGRGVEQQLLRERQGVIFVVLDAQARYRRAARYGDSLIVTCAVAQHSHASCSFTQEIYRDTLPGERAAPAMELLVNGRVRLACVDAKTFKPRPLPEVLEIHK